MPKVSSRRGPLLRSSVLDRLVDTEPQTSEEPAQIEGLDWTAMLAAVRRDILHLLNTRQHFCDQDLEDYPEARDSILTYGFPEFEAANPQSSEVQRKLRTAIEQAVRRFEPRLLNVRVAHVPTSRASRIVHFRLEARVHALPQPVRVSFDALMDVDRLECKLQERT